MLATKRCGWRVEQDSAAWSTRAEFPVTDATRTLKEALVVGDTLHVYVEEEVWAIVCRDVVGGKEKLN